MPVVSSGQVCLSNIALDLLIFVLNVFFFLNRKGTRPFFVGESGTLPRCLESWKMMNAAVLHRFKTVCNVGGINALHWTITFVSTCTFMRACTTSAGNVSRAYWFQCSWHSGKSARRLTSIFVVHNCRRLTLVMWNLLEVISLKACIREMACGSNAHLMPATRNLWTDHCIENYSVWHQYLHW